MKTETPSSAVSGVGAVTSRSGEPFIHKFKTMSHSYVFDVNTGEILQVDGVVWEIIEAAYLPKEEVISRYAGQFPPERIAAAYDEIQQCRSVQGLFPTGRPEVRPQFDREYVHARLAQGRGQVILNVTEQCNFRCSYCVNTLPHTGTRDHTMRQMSWETARAALDDFLRHCKLFRSSADGPAPRAPETFQFSAREAVWPQLEPPVLNDLERRVHVSFYGGEPLLNFPLIQQCTEYVLEKAGERASLVSFGMTTNGYLLKGEVAEFLAAHRFFLRVSLDGPVAVHDRHRRTVDHLPTWAVIVDNVKTFQRKYPQASLSLAATVARTENLEEVNRYLTTADWIPPRSRFSSAPAADPWPGYYPEDAAAQQQRLFHIRNVYRDYLTNLMKNRMNMGHWHSEIMLQRDQHDRKFEALHRARWACAQARRRSGSMSPDGLCLLGSTRLFVNVDGDYYPCERVHESEALRIGNVSTGMDEEKVYRLMTEFVDSMRTQCEQCWCLPFCGVSCFASIGGPAGYTPAAREEACANMRQARHAQIVTYCHVLEQNPHAFDYLREYDPYRELTKRVNQ